MVVARRGKVQVYRDKGRQPIHYDNGVQWYENKRGRWTGLSAVVNVNDGLATILHGNPAIGTFYEVRWIGDKNPKVKISCRLQTRRVPKQPQSAITQAKLQRSRGAIKSTRGQDLILQSI